MCSENANINDGFDPWVGANYGSPNDLDLPSRLLILGESHYDNGDPEEYRRSLTMEVIAAVIAEEQRKIYKRNYFKGVRKAVLGPSQEVDAKDFWQSVAFYNFIQKLVEKPGDHPTRHMWEEARDRFRKTLNRLRPRPTHVIVTGFRLWDQLPRDKDFWSGAPEDEVATIRKLVPSRFNNCKHERLGWLGRYRHGSGKCLVVKIQHLSRGSPAQWHPVIRDFLRMAP